MKKLWAWSRETIEVSKLWYYVVMGVMLINLFEWLGGKVVYYFG